MCAIQLLWPGYPEGPLQGKPAHQEGTPEEDGVQEEEEEGGGEGEGAGERGREGGEDGLEDSYHTLPVARLSYQ